MSTFEQGKSIGNVLGTIIFPFVLAYIIVFLYEKNQKKQIANHRILKIILLGIVLLVISWVGQHI